MKDAWKKRGDQRRSGGQIIQEILNVGFKFCLGTRRLLFIPLGIFYSDNFLRLIERPSCVRDRTE